MKTRTKLICCILASIAYLLCYLPAFDMHYAADDYGELAYWQHAGLNTMVVRFYSWSGSFSYTELSAMVKALPIWLPTVIILTLWWIIMAAILYEWTHDPYLAIGGSATFLTLMILALSTTSEPLADGTLMSPQYQAFYWQSSLCRHTACIVAFSLYFWLTIQHRLSPRLSLVLCWFVAFFMAGFSEVSVAFIPVMVLFGQPKRRNAGLAGATLAWLLIAVAPGNAVRGAFFARPPLLLGLQYALMAVPGFFKPYLTDGLPVLIIMVLAAALVGRYRCHHFTRKDKMLILKLFGCTLATIFLSFAPTYIALAAPIPHRAWIVPQFVFLAAITVVAYIVSSLTLDRRRGRLSIANRGFGSHPKG